MVAVAVGVGVGVAVVVAVVVVVGVAVGVAVGVGVGVVVAAVVAAVVAVAVVVGVGVVMLTLTDAEVDDLIRASFEPKIPRDVMPNPGPSARHNFRSGYARGVEDAAKAAEDCKPMMYRQVPRNMKLGYDEACNNCAAAIRKLRD